MTPKKLTDLDNLQGTWRVTALETDGGEMPDDVFDDATITIRGNAFTSSGMGDAYAGTIELVPAKKTKAFDLVFTSGPPEGSRNRGIYALTGDTWTICLATRGDARPRRFAVRADSGYALETLQRDGVARSNARRPERAKRPPRSPLQIPRVARDDGATSGAPTEIEGEFPMISAVINGLPLADNMVQWCKRITHGNVTMVVAGPQSMVDATFTLDAAHAPRHIDYVNRSGKSKGKSQAGIYELAHGTLRICMAAPGGARPNDFASTKGDGRSLTVWRVS